MDKATALLLQAAGKRRCDVCGTLRGRCRAACPACRRNTPTSDPKPGDIIRGMEGRPSYHGSAAGRNGAEVSDSQGSAGGGSDSQQQRGTESGSDPVARYSSSEGEGPRNNAQPPADRPGFPCWPARDGGESQAGRPDNLEEAQLQALGVDTTRATPGGAAWARREPGGDAAERNSRQYRAYPPPEPTGGPLLRASLRRT